MTELVRLAAADDAALLAEMARLIAFLDRVPDIPLKDVAYTCSLMTGPSVIALVVDDIPALRARLASAHSRLQSDSLRRIRDKSGTYFFRDHLLGPGKGKLAFLFPGVMSFYPDMMRDLVIEYPECRGAFDELEEAFSGEETFTPSSFIFPPASYYRQDAEIFSSGAYAQALVATHMGSVALSRLLRKGGLKPDGVVGFAGGELAAMRYSGAIGTDLPRPKRVEFIREFYRLAYKAVNHGGLPKTTVITAILRHPNEIDEVLAAFTFDEISLVVDSAPRQKTFVVSPEAEERVRAAFAARGIRTMKLALDRPFNTPLASSLVPAVRKFAINWVKQEPTSAVYSPLAAACLEPSVKTIREDLAGCWTLPVRFAETVRRMHDEGYRVFLEVGPRGRLAKAVEDTLKGSEHAAIAMNSIHRSGLLQLRHALAQLVALGAEIDLSTGYLRRQAKKIDFDKAVALEVRKDSEMKLSRAFPRLTLATHETVLSAANFLAEPKGRGAKAAQRAAAVAQNARRRRQFDFGAMNPLVSDADTLSSAPGVSVEITKNFKFNDLPFLGDYALGTSQLSYSDPNLRGLTLLSIPVGAEIMGETAALLAPNRTLIRIEDFTSRRMVSFKHGELRLFVRAERIAATTTAEIAIKVQLRDDSPNAAYTWPVMEATFVLAGEVPPSAPVDVSPLVRPRSVHWSGREIYPARLCAGRRLRGVHFVEAWSETGIDYEITVPPLEDNVAYTRFPLWVVNPLLLEIIVSGFSLWRSHERFAGAVSFPFRMRYLAFSGALPAEGARLKCYLRLTGVTPKSQLCDIVATDGNGKELLTITGWEELTERVPREYREQVMQPAVSFLTQSLSAEILGSPATDIASAFITDVPYGVFERNEELWLRIMSRVVLSSAERKGFREKTGSASRRTEWLFGRIAAKEAVRRFLKDYYQARWSDADIQIWPDDMGKPHALGAWSEFLTTKLDIAIAHTAQFVIAIAAANMRVGVDCESTARDLSEEFTAGVFTPEELELAAQALNSSQAIIRFWCAKEAVSKALGTGIRYSPREMIVVGYEPEKGKLTMRLEGGWLEAFKNFKGRDIEVTVRTVRDHALATCFIPAALFPQD